MIPSYIITLRETLEAALIVGIIIGYLKRTHQDRYQLTAWLAVGSGLALSIIGAYFFNVVAGGFTGRAEELFEGFAMIIGGILITTLIYWMMRRQNIVSHIHDKLDAHVAAARRWSIFGLVLIAVLREGIETVLFLESASFISPDHNLIGAMLGIGSAAILGILLYFGSLRINLKTFFTVTGIFLMLFGAGLMAHGVHELQEAGILSFGTTELWNINPSPSLDGVYPLLHENGQVGSFLKGLFGYNGNPSQLEVLVYTLYLCVLGFLWYHHARRPFAKRPR